MATNKTIIDINLKAHIPIGTNIEDQAKILNVVAKTHETGDYSEVLKLSKIDAVKAEMKRRRFEDEPEMATYEETMQALKNEDRPYVERITEDGRIAYSGKKADKQAIADYAASLPQEKAATDDAADLPKFLRPKE